MLRWRLLSAAVILTGLLTLLWLDDRLVLFQTPGAWLLPLLLMVSVLATEEVLSLLRAKDHHPIAWIVYLGNVLVPLAASLPVVLQLAGHPLPAGGPLRNGDWPLATLTLLIALAWVGEMAHFRQPGTAMVDAALSMLTMAYVGLCISFWARLRLHYDNAWGMAALVSMLLIVKMADVGAYTVGKNLGRHKLTPILSPGKTWEGAIGGIATACLTSWAFFHFAGPVIVGSSYVEPSPLAALTYGALLALAGMVGDLAESLLKRDMERKDSSSWLPGLGGVLDIIDAPLMAGPVAWLCWTLGLIGP